jgi:hypothetical protein
MAKLAPRRCSIPLAFVAVLALPGAAGAQGGDPAAAAELFRQGRAALLEKRYDVACAALAESERLDPRVGTLLNLAQCEEVTGKLAGARAHLEKALRIARTTGDPREAHVTEQRDALLPRVPQLTLLVAPGAPDDTRVRLDGVDVAPGDLGVAMPLDPGVHVVVASAPGRAARRFEVDAAEGSTQELRVEPGEAGAAPPAPSPVAPAPLAPVERPASPRAGAGDTQRWIAYAAGGLGLVALGLGAYWGIQAINARDDPRCQGGVCNDEAAAQTQRDGRDAGNRSTIAFVAGGALVVGAVVLLLTAPRAPRGSL